MIDTSKIESDWVQPYRGPFTKKEAVEIAKDFLKNKIFAGAIAQQRGDTKHYDVFIRINKNYEF